MLETKAAIFKSKEPAMETQDCVIEKIIRISDSEFDNFASNLLKNYDFIKDNTDHMFRGEDGRRHCLLVMGEGRKDGILVESQGYDYARYTSLLPNAEDFLTVGQYKALTDLNKELTGIVDAIAEHAGEGNPDGRGVVDLQRWDDVLGIDLMTNAALRGTVLRMLDERSEIRDWELDKNELIIYREQEPVPVAENLTDPSVSMMDMYTYGYSWDGMIPLGRERALELYDNKREVYMLHTDGTESTTESRTEIEAFDGLFGVEDPAWARSDETPPFQVFIVNREKYDKGEASGEWLTLPVLPGDLLDTFSRIGVDRPSEGAFTITAVRVPFEYLRDHVSKYDSLDEINMLASYMASAEDWYDLDKFHAILASGIADIGRGTTALINLLDTDNIECFELIDAKGPESLAKYYDRENNEKPDSVSFEEYGVKCVAEEGGVFTEWGYVKLKYNDLSPQYTGVVPDEYRITGMALHALRKVELGRGSDEKPSVIDQIRAARQAHQEPKDKDERNHNKRKGDPEL